jgi:hypothetical protein
MSSEPIEQFDESTGLDDPPPFPGWLPSPAQISGWCTQIRAERLNQQGPGIGAIPQPTEEEKHGDQDNHNRSA